MEEEPRREEEHTAEQAQLRARFVDGPRLSLPVTDAFRFSFDPNRVRTVDGVGSVYAPLRVTEAWGVLEVTSGGGLLRGAGR